MGLLDVITLVYHLNNPSCISPFSVKTILLHYSALLVQYLVIEIMLSLILNQNPNLRVKEGKREGKRGEERG